MDEERLIIISALQERLGYRFSNPKLLEEALTHRSFAHEQYQSALKVNPDEAPPNYERLEFLGDAALDLAISHLLMERFPKAQEGDLSRLRARLVNIDQLAAMALALKLDQSLRLGKGEETTRGREKLSILSAAYEACIGAIYLDSGYLEAFRVISGNFKELIEGLDEKCLSWDYKTSLQEKVQAEFKCVPNYKVVREEGPDHDKTFEVAVLINGKLQGKGLGKSKKEAEQQAAKATLELLAENDSPEERDTPLEG